jgi:hypothetical protein
MSFEDNMIDDGFYDEIDYMDYLMNKAIDDEDERRRLDYLSDMKYKNVDEDDSEL